MNRQIKYALFAASLVMVGMLAGFKLRQSVPEEKKELISSNLQKFQDAVWYVEKNYVRETDTRKMVDDAIEGMLEGLDPHSFYIPAKEMQEMEEEMQGSFEGIGVEFNILEDTIYVVSPISGGPSDKLGIQAGDRIVKINGENVAGIGITNSDVMKKLKGPKGSIVKVGIHRRGTDKTLNFDIERDKIPLYSVDYSYMMNPEVGYIKVSRFSGTTHDEFKDHLYKLKQNGLKNLVLDLRGNPGGYMDMAEKLADEFLAEGKLVVYTDGRVRESHSRYSATSYLKMFETGGLVVLLDYGSASASEIVAGAVQDWDRGLIVGVRSFGKGLVQTQKPFSDGSAMRLVISQYFTPSGRCIQKPYDVSSREYEAEILERFTSGEIYDPTKIEFPDSLKFKTNAGRTVYGGGGIMPDVFVPRDTNEYSDYLTDLIAANCFRQFSFKFGDDNPDLKSRYPDAATFNSQFKTNEKVMKDFLAFAKESKVEYDAQGFKISERVIKAYVKAFIGRRLHGDDSFYPAFHETDNVLQKAVELVPKAVELEKKGTFTQNN